MGGASPIYLDSSVGANYVFTLLYAFAMGTFTLFGSLTRTLFINNLQTLPIISILILLIFFRAGCTFRGGTYFATTGYIRVSTAGGGTSPRSVWFFPHSTAPLPCFPMCASLPYFNGMLLESLVESLY